MLIAKQIVRPGLAAALIAGFAALAGPVEAAPPSSAWTQALSVRRPPIASNWGAPTQPLSNFPGARPQSQTQYVSPYAFLGGGIQSYNNRPRPGVISSNIQPRQSYSNSLNGADPWINGPSPNMSYYHCVPNVGKVGPDGICH